MPLRLLLIAIVLCLSATAFALPQGSGPLAPGLAAAHPEPGDVDGDNIKDEVDNCVTTPNGAQVDTDGDKQGDSCDADDDNDGVPDASDNCRVKSNPGQENADGDAFGDACPPVDSDTDGVIDPDDNCDSVANPDQRDFDGDDRGDPCDSDYDGDKFDNGFDNCPTVYNPTRDTEPPFRQPDADGNGKGTACDPDEGLATGSPTGGGSAGGPTASGPGTVVAPKDTRKPTVSLTVARRHSGVATTDPFVIPVGCSEACSLEATLVVDAKTARKLRLGGRKATLARGSWAVAGRAKTYVMLDWQRRARSVLKRWRSFDARVIVVAKDTAGNATTASKAVTLRR